MCGTVVVVTRWWLGWLLGSVACVMALVGANLSPSWLLADPHHGLPTTHRHTSGRWWGERESVGLWLRCVHLPSSPSLHCGVYATSVPDLPAAQVGALVGVVSGTVVTVLGCLAVALTACLTTIKGQPWFGYIGTTQAVAGVLSLVGVAVFPLSWNSARVRNLCGAAASLYYPDKCTVGWATYATLVASIGLLLCSCVSTAVARAVRSPRVADHVSRGHSIVCLL